MNYQFKTQPFAHQLKELTEHGDVTARAVLWEMGTGKTKVAIDSAALLYEQGDIDALVVVAPSGVHLNWVTDELPAHLPDRVMKHTRMLAYANNKSETKWQREAVKELVGWKGFAVIAVTYDLFITDNGKRDLWKVLKARRCMMVLDEASAIKTPSARRTKSIIMAGRHAPFRRVLEGTPVSNGPFDVYAPIRFLDEEFWSAIGFSTFTEFKANFGVFRKHMLPGKTMKHFNPETKRYEIVPAQFDQLLGYRRLDELHEILQGISSRVLKEHVLDLPPKVYTRRRFELTPRQQRMYEELRDEFYTEVQDKFLSAPLAITRLLRLQQITCGYFPADDEEELTRIEGGNPRLDQLNEVLDQLHGKAIIWARFTQDIDDILALAKKRRMLALRYDGKVSEGQRAEAKHRFINDPNAHLFVSKPSVGGRGLTLTVANTVVYYSNEFKLRERLQSEDRAHRHGQTGNVTYVDLIANNTVDEKIVNSLRNKFDIASQITGDHLREWL